MRTRLKAVSAAAAIITCFGCGAADARFLQVDPVDYKDQVNLYAYVNNDPTDNRDPTGLYICDANPSQCKSVQQGLDRISEAAKGFKANSPEARALNTVVAAYGKQGVNNGVTVNVAALDKGVLGQAVGNKSGVTVTLDFKQINRAGGLSQGAVTLAHEGVHGIMRLAGRDPVDNHGVTREEAIAYKVGGYASQGMGFFNPVGPNGGTSTFGQDVLNAARKDCVYATSVQEATNANHQQSLPGPCY